MNDEQEKTLLADVKTYLDITWEDAQSDKKLIGMIKRGMNYLQNIAGSSFLDFSQENNGRALLLDYCRYARSSALEMFEKNFLSQLNALRIGNLVRRSGVEDES